MSRTKASTLPFVSLRTRLVAGERKATALPFPLTDGRSENEFPMVPSGLALTVVNAPEARSFR